MNKKEKAKIVSALAKDFTERGQAWIPMLNRGAAAIEKTREDLTTIVAGWMNSRIYKPGDRILDKVGLLGNGSGQLLELGSDGCFRIVSLKASKTPKLSKRPHPRPRLIDELDKHLAGQKAIVTRKDTRRKKRRRVAK